MTTAFVFPGQGSQFVGMGRELAEASTAARAVFEEVDEALGEKLSAVIFEGPEEDLRLTRNTQPALMAVSMGLVRHMEAKGLRLADSAVFVAGHSLGEYSALAAAGSLDITATARLLRRRGDAMQDAVPVGEGAMAAVLGLDLAEVEAIAAEAAEVGVCDAANDNAPGQVVVSGARAAVEKAIELASAKGARRSMLLPVSAPFHSALMAPAAEVMATALAETEIGVPAVPLIANVTAAPVTEPDDIRRLLVAQVTGRVRWRESVLKLGQLGVTRIVEIGAGKVLTGLGRRIDREIEGHAVQSEFDADEILEMLT